MKRVGKCLEDIGGGRGVCCQGLSEAGERLCQGFGAVWEVEVHSMDDILEVVRRAQARDAT